MQQEQNKDFLSDRMTTIKPGTQKRMEQRKDLLPTDIKENPSFQAAVAYWINAGITAAITEHELNK